MKKRNFLNLRGFDISKDLAENCFTEEQKAILEYQQGKIKVTIEDQLNRVYGCKIATWDKETTIKYGAQIVEEFEYLIDEIGRKKELIIQLKNPENYRELTTTKSKGSTATGSKTTTKGSSVNVILNEGLTDVEDNYLGKSFTANPTKLINNLSLEEDKNKVEISFLTHEKKSFTEKNFENKSELVKVDKTIEQNKPIVFKPEELSFHNTTLSRDIRRNRSKTYDSAENRGLNDSNTDIVGSICSGNYVEGLKSVKAKEYERALRAEIPRLRAKFWNKFLPLFADIDICDY